MTTMTLDNAVELAGPELPEFSDSRVTGSEHAKQIVALHAAATLVPNASLTQREQIRVSWLSALSVVWDQYEHWAIVYLPGHHHGENDTYAVHKLTGRIIGGDCPRTGQQAWGRHAESTSEWLRRINDGAASF